MAAPFRFFDPVPQFRNALGELIPGGTVTFYDSNTTTPRNVYTDDTLGTSLGNVLTLDSDARWSEDPWLDGSYRVLVKDADGATVWQRDEYKNPATAGLTPPDAADGTDGQALFTDGTTGGFYWDDVLTIPTQTGNAGKYLGTDGESLAWQAFAEADTPTTITAGATGFTAGGYMLQVGTGTCPTAGANNSSVAVTFATAFTSAPMVLCGANSSGAVTADGARAFVNATSPSTTGFTAVAAAQDEHGASSTNISSTVPFTYFAYGPVA